MHRLALILLLYPLVATSGTFELSDPAAEIYEEQQAPPKQQEHEKDLLPVEEIFCAVDEKQGNCWCVHTETAKVVAIEHEVCVIYAAQISSPKP